MYTVLRDALGANIQLYSAAEVYSFAYCCISCAAALPGAWFVCFVKVVLLSKIRLRGCTVLPVP